ncbi:putative ABC transporter ATP-binding protein [Selenomonas ruminantium subsp. lactilytica TAM6421]|uniref:Putative ABC transporter ATP-binding protein n=1 Tax=Selenomonas ruminantium subsp. lactilytica (strain NBRC 103574 / TAM6421) TaxID=927704 RepID=I0GQ46_SELRL|nr:ABC transporter ATP-binding protein [Selenomonas ruminantium]BAL82883.1 putative ABC transporter ATP-binding protein [Selenomonas ruminantium subsp. lactilytica TAM6421]
MSIIIENVNCSRKGREILHNVSLQVQAGEVMGLLGPNGAGKTTLIRLLSGLARPDKGRIMIQGENAADRSVAFRRLLGLVPQENNFESELTIEQSMLCYARLYGLPDPAGQVEASCERFRIGNWRQKKPDKLSGGMKRRAMIARAMLPDPQVLLLDEPSVGLDPDMRQEIWQLLKGLQAEGKTILLTTHYMEEAEALCSRIAFLRGGRLLYTGTCTDMRHWLSPQRAISLEDAFVELSHGQLAQEVS